MQVGPYQVLGEIARGGMGSVYRAQDAAGQVVALKLLHAERSASEHARKRFRIEVQALTRLRHPGVVTILGAGEHQGRQWLALEFVEGETLASRLRHGALGLEDATRIGQRLAQALGYVHECGVLHRDLKPDNVLMRGEQPLLTDFGLALDEGGSISRVTRTGVSQGTPGYWAPEQAQGQTALFSAQTDLYGLGAVLYACLTGQAPVQATSLQEHLELASFRSVVAPRRVRPEVPKWLSELCMRCLAVEPSARPASASEVSRALVLGEAKPDRPASHTTIRLVALGAVALATIAGLGVSALATRTPPQERSEASTQPVAPEQESHPQRVPDEAPPAHVEPADLERAQRLGAEGERLLEAFQDERALACFEEALALAPGQAALLALRGAAKSRLERYADAIEDYDQALRLQPDDSTCLFNRAYAKGEVGRFAEAVEDYDHGLKLSPNDAKALVQRGSMKGELGRPAEAIEDYDEALQLDPSYALGYVNRGIAEGALGRHSEAIASYDQALRLQPDDARTYTSRGLAFLELGRDAEALADFDRSEALEPGQPLALINRGFTKLNLGRPAEAIQDYDHALSLEPTNAEAFSLRGQAKVELGQFVEALADYDASVRHAPQVAETYAFRGLARSRLQRHAQAIEDYTRALELGDTRVKLYRNRGGARINMKRYALAIEDYDEALRLEPSEPSAWAFRGFAKLNLERKAEAIADFDAALRRNPTQRLAAQVQTWREAALAE